MLARLANPEDHEVVAVEVNTLNQPVRPRATFLSLPTSLSDAN
jgi:hypothetical protein